MKIVFAGASGDRYGADIVLASIARHMSERGYEALLVLPVDGPGRRAAEEFGLRVEIRRMPVLRRAEIHLRGLVRLVGAIAPSLASHLRLLRRERPDVVWVNTVTIPLWLAAARLLRRRVVCHCHETVGGRSAWRRLLYAPLFLAHLVIAVSDACRRDIVSAWPSLATRVAVEPNPSFSVDGPIPIHPGAEDDIVILGRISARKGHHVVIDALRHPAIAHHRRPLTVHVCGTSYPSAVGEGYERAVRERAASVAARIEFHGYLPTRDALMLGGIVVVPSTEPESNPLVIGEAIVAGRIVIASDVGGVREAARDVAILVKPDDADGLAAAIARVLTDDAARAGVLAAARSRTAQFAVDPYYARILALTEWVSWRAVEARLRVRAADARDARPGTGDST